MNNLLKTAFVAFACATVTIQSNGQLPVKVEGFPLSDVRITDGMFKHAEDMDIRYLLALDPDRLLAPYLKEAQLTPKAPNYTNWENTGLDGHIGGHYLSALSFMYAATGNKEIKGRLDYMISELKRCQDTSNDGYLCGVPGGRRIWKEIEGGNIKASGFGLNGGWVPLYNIHKIYAGLRDAYLHTGSAEARNMLVKLTNWMMKVVSGLSDDQIQDMLRSEHGGLNEIFADVASITGDSRYIKLAHRFSHQVVLQPLIKHEDKLTGMHANTQIPKVIGFKRIADVEGKKDWSDAAQYFWETVVDNRTISIGGNSVREHFHPSTDFGSMLTSEQGPETCNTYNMLRLSKMLYQTSAETKFMNYYEQALFNHILSTQDPIQGGFVYFTPMRSGHYRVYSQPQTSFWCCVGSGLENHARYGEMIYGHKEDELFVNLFIPSTLKWKDIDIEQKTAFPDEEATTIIVNPKKSGKQFTMNFRIAEWADPENIKLYVNGKLCDNDTDSKRGYVTLTRKWNKGDKVKVEMPMHLIAKGLPDGSDNYSFMYGPIVLAAEMGKQNQDGMFADDSRGGHIANGPRTSLQNMPVIVGDKNDILSHVQKVEGKPLTFRLSGVYPDNYEGMILQPFFRLYECRYMVYWPVLSEQELQIRRELLSKEEKERIALDAVTSDKVICGEQQPESDHFITMDKSYMGDDDGVHWRCADGWFGYKMKTNGKSVNKVRIVMRQQPDRNAKLMINGKEVAIFTGKEKVCILDIPAAALNADTMEITITSNEGRATPCVYEIRLIAVPPKTL